MLWVFVFVFSGLTGYIGQEDDLYSGREALIVRSLGRRSNLANLYSIPSESGEYLISFFLLLLLLQSLLEHWGQCSS
jgi:hypothetical protein